MTTALPARFGALLAAGWLAACATTTPPLEFPDGAPRRFVEVDDGLAVAVVDRPADEPDPDAPTLVLVHGWACDRAFWGQLPARLGRDHRVVTLDLPGHGESDASRREWDVRALGQDVRAVCATLALDDVVLIGHSMGAVVSLSAAAGLRGRVRGVLAVDSLHAMAEEFPAEQFGLLADTFEQRWVETMTIAVRSMVPRERGAALQSWILARALRTDPALASDLIRSFVGLDQPGLAAAAGVPIRAVNAAPWEGGAETELERNRGVADYDAVLIEGVGHYLQLERPEAVERALREFLATLKPAVDGP